MTDAEKTSGKQPSIRDLSLLLSETVLAIPGVCRFANAPSDSFRNIPGLTKPVKGVRISDDAELSVDLYIDVDYGVKIPQLAWDIQSKVKEALSQNTDRPIKEIDIHVQGICMDQGEEND